MSAAATSTEGSVLRNINFKNYGIIYVTVILFIVLSLTTDGFLSTANLRNVLDQQSLILIAGSAMTLTLIGGNFDISVSAVFINASITAGLLHNATDSALIAIGGAIVVGALFGLVNGIVVARVKVNSFIGTLATSFVFFGIGFVLSDRSIVRVENRDFLDVARGRDFGLTNATWIALFVVAFFWFLLERTSYGRKVFATGGNPEAARLAGVRVEAITTSTFVMTGAAAGLAGALLVSRTTSAQASDDFSFVFAVLTAVIIGGTSIAGGEGAVWRTLLGALFIAILTNAFNLLQIDPVIQRLVQGAVILGAVAADNWTRSRRS